MELATIFLALGGDVGNTIPKYEVTPGEVAVLRQIHGNESVTEIDVHGSVARTHRAELERLRRNYGRPMPDGRYLAEAVDALFPGAAARVFEQFDELNEDDAPENFFKAKRVGADANEAEPEGVPLVKLSKTQLLQIAAKNGVEVSERDTKAEIIAAIEAAPPKAETDDEDDDGGIADIGGDKNLFQ